MITAVLQSYGIFWKASAAAFAFFVVLAFHADAAAREPQTGLPRATVTITDGDGAGAPIVFAAEVADTAATRNFGMMFRRGIADDEAMLFVYERPQQASFWMRNTLIPLDLIFIAPDGAVIRVHENARPLDETPIPSGGVVRSVLEIRGGLARELGIAPGDQVRSIALSRQWPMMRGRAN